MGYIHRKSAPKGVYVIDHELTYNEAKQNYMQFEEVYDALKLARNKQYQEAIEKLLIVEKKMRLM
jgi:hypothetical protein